MKTIYLVQCFGGSWDDAYEYVLRAYENQEEAERFVKLLQGRSDAKRAELADAENLEKFTTTGIEGDPNWHYTFHDPPIYGIQELELF